VFFNLADLSTVTKSENEFLRKENRLDILQNNAGAVIPPAASKTAQVVSSFMVSLFAQADHMGCFKSTTKLSWAPTVRVRSSLLNFCGPSEYGI
jgi:hypothetical protein